jgi:prepilin peptidase CpaA
MPQADLVQIFRLPPTGTLSPLLLSVIMAVGDWRTRRIPNYLTFGGALAGLVFQTATLGWPGFGQAILGWFLGLALLLLPFIYGGMGAGDVKALAALGAWVGPKGIFSVFCYMGLAGGILSLGILVWHGVLGKYLRQGLVLIQNMILCRSQKIVFETLRSESELTAGLPYGVAIAFGMVAYVKFGNFF